MVLRPEFADLGGRRVLLRNRSIFEVPPLIADCDGGWCVSCHNVMGEGDDVAIKSGPVGLGER